jgi:hypothetical protein
MVDRDDREHLGVVPIDRMLGDTPQETFALRRTYSEARATMKALGIVQRIEQAWFGGGIGEVVGVFLFRFVDLDGNDMFGWLVCGDIPWFFAPFTEGDSSRGVLERYVALARKWNAAGGVEPECCFFGPYHGELASALNTRLQFIEERVVPLVPLPRPFARPPGDPML